MELAYRLAVDDAPYIKYIRRHVITLITPIVEVDGRDRMVDLYGWHRAHPGEQYPPLMYWGHYVAHDNNRDAMGVTLDLTRNVLDTYVGWHAQVLHDLHESVPFLYDNTVGDGPYNAWIDPILTNEWQMLGWNNVQQMTKFGMPGVFTHGDFDTWSPGYLMFIAATHNGISRLYETFGNGGADTVEAHPRARTNTRAPGTGRIRRCPRCSGRSATTTTTSRTGLLTALHYFAENGQLFLDNFYLKSKRSIEKPVRRPGRLRAARRRHAPGRAGAAAAHACSSSTSRSVAPARRSPCRRRRVDVDGVTPPAADATAAPRTLPRRQLHRAHGPAVFAHRRRAAGSPVLGAGRSAEASLRRHRLVLRRPVRRGRRTHRRSGSPESADAHASDERCRVAGVRPGRARRAGQAAAHRADAHLARHADRRLVAHGAGQAARAVQLHQHPGCRARSATCAANTT